MRLNRFIGNYKLQKGRLVVVDTALSHQMRNVLHLRSGELVELCDGKGMQALAEIDSFRDDGVEFKISDIYKNEKEPGIRIILYCALLKGDHFELVAQKTTEAGIAEIVPVLTERVVKEGLRHDRIEKIIREAAEQSGRGVLPVLGKALSFKDAVQRATNHGAGIFFNMDGDAFEDLRVHPTTEAGIFIGPEGGWKEEEVQLAKDSGLSIASMGALTLRAETAAIIATYLVAKRFG